MKFTELDDIDITTHLLHLRLGLQMSRANIIKAVTRFINTFGSDQKIGIGGKTRKKIMLDAWIKSLNKGKD